MSTLLGTFAKEAERGQVIYSNTRTLWVEPATGLYLKVQEKQKKVLQPSAGGRPGAAGRHLRLHR